MLSVVGIDSRILVRNPIKKDGTRGEFISVIGMAVRVQDYESFDKQYQNAMEKAFTKSGLEKKYKYYSVNDLRDNPSKNKIIETFFENINEHIEKVHIFYTLFSKKRAPVVKVYGRYSRNKKIKLSKPTRTYKEFIHEHLVNCFPGICGWRLMKYFSSGTTQFHLDSYEGHICEAQEEFEKSNFEKFTFPSGDCTNPVISTADLLLDLFDIRLSKKKLLLIFQNIRLALPEFGNKILAYPFLNKHLPKITPLDKISVSNYSFLRPVYWVFKGDASINSGDLKRSEAYRNLLDCVAHKGGTIKLFSKSKDSKLMNPHDYGVYWNNNGKEIIKTYNKMGKKLQFFNIDLTVPDDHKNI